MQEQIIIVGSGLAAQTALQNLKHDNVLIISPEEINQLPFSQLEPYVLQPRYSPELESVYIGKQFVCKGKHQYRHTDTIKNEGENGTITKQVWSCQCGKVLK